MFEFRNVLELLILITKLLRSDADDEETKALAFLDETDIELAEKCFQTTLASWNYLTNINDLNLEIQLNVSLESSKFSKTVWEKMTADFKSWHNFTDPDLKRRFEKSIFLGASALPEEDLVQVLIQKKIY